MDLIFKSFKVMLDAASLKKLDEGVISIVFATMNVVDKDGDVALPGFYGVQDIVMVPAHDWSHVPIGKGKTREEGDLAIADIKLNLEIQAAKDWLSAIKFDLANGEPVQEYSYGFKTLEGGTERGDRDGKQVRYLKPREDGTPGSKIWEVSPVLVGAGEKTRTLSAKGVSIKSMAKCAEHINLAIGMHEVHMAEPESATVESQKMMMEHMTEARDECMAAMGPMKGAVAGAGKTFADESQAVLDAAEGLVERVEVLAAIRAKDGRELGAPAKEKLAAMVISFDMYAKKLAALTAPVAVVPTPEEIEARRELVRMAKGRAGLK